jgi:hypothetical protein
LVRNDLKMAENRLKTKKNLNFSWKFEIKFIHLQRFMF